MTESNKEPKSSEPAKQPAAAPKPAPAGELTANDLDKVTGGATMVERKAG